MKAIPWLWTVVLFVPLAVAGCTGSDQKNSAGKQYPIKGKVVAVDQSKPAVRIDHEEIPGLMPAMEMDYPVEDARLLESIKAGDRVQGQLRAESGKYVITRLEKR